MSIQRWQSKPPLGARINPTHPLSRGLIGAWLFNEGTGPSGFNSLRSPNDLVVNGAATLGSQGFNVTGIATSFGNAAYNAAFDSTTLSVAFGFSIGTVAGGTFPALISRASNSASISGIVITGTSKKLSLTVKNAAGTSVVNITSGTKTIDDSQRHIGVVCLNAASPGSMYVDGVLDQSFTPSGAWDFSAGSWPVRWGAATDAFWNPQATAFYWTYWYNRVLSQSEVVALQCNPYLMFQSPPSINAFVDSAIGIPSGTLSSQFLFLDTGQYGIGQATDKAPWLFFSGSMTRGVAARPAVASSANWLKENYWWQRTTDSSGIL